MVWGYGIFTLGLDRTAQVKKGQNIVGYSGIRQIVHDSVRCSRTG